MAKKINKPLLWNTDEAGSIFIKKKIFRKTQMRPLSFHIWEKDRWKTFEIDVGGPEKGLTFLASLIEL